MACCRSGLSTVMYGTTGENIISLLVVTPKGELVSKTSDIFYTFFFFFVLVGSYIPFLEPDTNKEKVHTQGYHSYFLSILFLIRVRKSSTGYELNQLYIGSGRLH